MFDTIAAAALKLCGASCGERRDLRRRADPPGGGRERESGSDRSDTRRSIPRPPSRDTAVTRAILTRSVVAIPDVLEDPDYVDRQRTRTSRGFRSVLAVPLMRDGSADRRHRRRSARTRAILRQADRAAPDVRRPGGASRSRTCGCSRSWRRGPRSSPDRSGELKALGEVGQAVSSTLDLETVLRTIVSRATQLAGMDGGAIYEYDEAREEFHLHTTDRAAPRSSSTRCAPLRSGRARARSAGWR